MTKKDLIITINFILLLFGFFGWIYYGRSTPTCPHCNAVLIHHKYPGVHDYNGVCWKCNNRVYPYERVYKHHWEVKEEDYK